ncbi:MAG: hypothetical protein WCF04_07615 [Candidatus Nanopelagicales bacterium]
MAIPVAVPRRPDLAGRISIALTGATGLLAVSPAVVIAVLVPAQRRAQRAAFRPRDLDW